MICTKKKSQSRHTRVNSACPDFFTTHPCATIFSLTGNDNELNCARLDLDGNICLPGPRPIFFLVEKICITEDNCTRKRVEVHNAPLPGWESAREELVIRIDSIIYFVKFTQKVFYFNPGRIARYLLNDFPSAQLDHSIFIGAVHVMINNLWEFFVGHDSVE